MTLPSFSFATSASEACSSASSFALGGLAPDRGGLPAQGIHDVLVLAPLELAVAGGAVVLLAAGYGLAGLVHVLGLAFVGRGRPPAGGGQLSEAFFLPA